TTPGGSGHTSLNAAPLNGETLNRAGKIPGNVNNSGGNVSPGTSPGTINVTGNYTQGSAGTMTIELGGTSGGQYDVFAVTSNVTLDGTLNVSLINSFIPSNGNSWQPFTFANRTGDFAVKNLPTFSGTHGSITATYTPTALVLTAVVTAQSTDLATAVNGPATVNAGAPLAYTVTITNNGPDPTSVTT